LGLGGISESRAAPAITWSVRVKRLSKKKQATGLPYLNHVGRRGNGGQIKRPCPLSPATLESIFLPLER
jgi:hypothetical protein